MRTPLDKHLHVDTRTHNSDHLLQMIWTHLPLFRMTFLVCATQKPQHNPESLLCTGVSQPPATPCQLTAALCP